MNNIISTEFGHVIKTASKARPFRICKNGRLVSFKTLEAAIKAQAAQLQDAHANVRAMRDSGVSC